MSRCISALRLIGGKRTAAVAGMVVMAGATASQASPITITNASFEDQSVAPGNWGPTNDVTGWQRDGWGSDHGVNFGIAGETGTSGSGGAATDPATRDGVNDLYVNGYGWGYLGAVAQTLGALQPNTTYTFTVGVALRHDQYAGTYGTGNASAVLRIENYNTGEVLGQTVVPVTTLRTDAFQDFPVTGTTNSTVSGTLAISLGAANIATEGGSFPLFDNVRGTAEVPEPASIGLLASGTLALGMRHRRLA